MKSAFAAVAATLMLAAIPAKADILATGSRVGNYSNSTTGTWVTVPINGTFSSVTFSTSAPNQIVRISYNAECGAVGSLGTWLAVKILVDNVEAAPASSSAFALCTSTNTSSYSWVGALRQSTIKVPHSGAHKVTVQGYGASTTSWWLGDSSIVVDR